MDFFADLMSVLSQLLASGVSAQFNRLFRGTHCLLLPSPLSLLTFTTTSSYTHLTSLPPTTLLAPTCPPPLPPPLPLLLTDTVDSKLTELHFNSSANLVRPGGGFEPRSKTVLYPFVQNNFGIGTLGYVCMYIHALPPLLVSRATAPTFTLLLL